MREKPWLIDLVAKISGDFPRKLVVEGVGRCQGGCGICRCVRVATQAVLQTKPMPIPKGEKRDVTPPPDV